MSRADRLARYLRDAGRDDLLDQRGIGDGRQGYQARDFRLGNGQPSYQAPAYCAICGRPTSNSRTVTLEEISPKDRYSAPARRFIGAPCCPPCSRKRIGTRAFTITAVVLWILYCGLGGLTRLFTDTTVWGEIGAWTFALAAVPLLPTILGSPRATRKDRVRKSVPEIENLCRQGWYIVH